MATTKSLSGAPAHPAVSESEAIMMVGDIFRVQGDIASTRQANAPGQGT
jgi:hypothetical protein